MGLANQNRAFRIENPEGFGGEKGEKMDDYKIWQMKENIDAAISLTLKQLQTAIQTRVNIRDTASLTALQTCCHQLFKDASETLESGLFYQVDDYERDDTNEN